MAIVLFALVTAITFGLSAETPVSFYGGYHRESLPHGQKDTFTVQFDFRSIQDSGVLVLATFSGNATADYVAVVFGTGSQVQVLLSQGGQVSTLTSINSTMDFTDWHHLELKLVNKTLQTKVQNLLVGTHTFPNSVLVDSVYFGGPESFFTPLYSGLPLPRYYVGCMANVTLNSRPLQLGVGVPGLATGCCMAPRYPLWCLDMPHANLTLTFPLVSPAADMLTVSFRLRLLRGEDGLVLSASQWYLQLLQGRLQLVAGLINTSCPGVLADSAGWHQVEVVLRSNSISCSVNGMVEASTIPPSLLVFPRLLQLGGASQHAGGRGFVGCFQRPRVNGADLAVHMVESGEGNVELPSINWSDFSFNTTDVVVTEHSTAFLSSAMWVQLPHDEFADDLTALYQLELEKVIHFEAFLGPSYGHLYIGQRAGVVERFDYENIVSSDPSLQVAYSHDHPGNYTDVVVFTVWAGCDGVVFQQEVTTLVLSIEERYLPLTVGQPKPLRLAVGTQRVITPDILAVEHPEAFDPESVLYRVQFVSLLSSKCSSCLAGDCERCAEGEEEGGQVLKDGVSVKLFYQEDIDRGVVSFQHFESYSTAPVAIRLGVSAEGSTDGILDITIPVTLYEGHINLTSNPSTDCVFVKEDGLALISPVHLSVATNFDDQNPVITYDLLTLPNFGILQLYDEEGSEWLDLANSTTLHTAGEAPPTSFTQADMSNGHVRYMQSESFSFSDSETFQFHVRSYNFSSNITAHLCVNIIPEDIVFQPTISVHLTSLAVAEGASVPINHTVFNTSLDKEGYMYLVVQPDLDLQQLDVTYTLVDPPSFGRLQLQSDTLVAGDMFAHRDVTSSALVYFHDGSEDHEDQFSFYGETGSVEYLPIRAPNRTVNLTLVIDVTPVNDNPPVWDVDVESIRPPEGCWVQVRLVNINVTDIDRPVEKLRIYLRKKGTTPTGIFAFREEPDEAIADFYMQDILDQRVIFAHQLGSPLNYTQTLRIDDGDKDHTIKRPIIIAAVPLILNVSLPLHNSQCFATIDADAPDLQVRLNSIEFSATLCDQFGNNADLVPAITVTIVESPVHGRVSWAGPDNSTVISQFQFRDLKSLVYVLENRNVTGDIVGLEFSHGHSDPVRHVLRICILPALAPLRLSVTALELVQGGNIDITVQHLLVTSSREDGKNSLVFNVLRGPQHGVLLNKHSSALTHPISQFTHGDLVRSDIVYDYTSSVLHTQDEVVVRVCSPFSCLPQQTLPISIYSTNLTVQNSTIHVREGGTYHFKLSDFNVSAPPDYYDIHIVIEEDKPPMHGELFIQTPFSNSSATYFGLDDISKLRYTNVALENLMDMVEMIVVAEGKPNTEAEHLPFILWIVIEPVNHHPPSVISPLQNLTVVQGETVLLDESVFRAHDFDAGSEDDDLEWCAKFYPRTGYLFLDTDLGSSFSVDSWKGKDVRTSRLYFHNTNRMLSHDILILEVSDGERSTRFTLLIHIVSVNLRRHSAPPFIVEEGDEKRISFDFLRYYANDNALNDSDILLTLQDSPYHGQLELGGSALTNQSFTQNMIHSRKLVYIHDDSNTIKDNFTFYVVVPTRQDDGRLEMFEIFIEPVDDDPPEADIPERMFVVELQRVEIDNTTFRLLDSDSTTKVKSNQVVGQLVQPLIHGRLEKLRHGLHINHTENFTKFDLEDGKVYYRHLGLPDQRPDRLVFNLTDGYNNTQEFIYNMTIIILPRVISLTISGLVVTENKIAPITEDEIMVNHYYLRHARGIFIVVKGPSHGRLVDTAAKSSDNQVHSFTTDNIANKSICYYHNGDEGLEDSFQFRYEALEPPDYDRTSELRTFNIDITPVNDQEPVIRGNTSLGLWATETVLIDERYLNITDNDTPPSKLIITVQIQTIHGHLAFANNTAAHIHQFTQADVYDHVIRFVHLDGPNGHIRYNVTDGVHTASGIIPVYADTLALECLTSLWKSINVEFLGIVMVTSANLQCTTSDGLNNREILYRFRDIQLGHFEVNSQTRSEFNSTEVTDGLVTFVHTETGLWMEEEILLVHASSHPASPESDLPLLVTVSYPQPPPGSQLAVNTGVRLREGESAVINEAMLDGRNIRYEAWLNYSNTVPPGSPPEYLAVLYEVVQAPRHGNLTLTGSHIASFTQGDLTTSQLNYTHDDSETLADSILLNVTVQLPGGEVVLYELESVQIAVTPINDHAPLLQGHSVLQKSLVKGFVSILTSQDVEIADADNSPAQVQLKLLSLPNNTQLLLNGSALTINSTITQSYVNQQWITLNPFAAGDSKFTFKFTDGELGSDEVVEFTLTVQDHFLQLVSSQNVVSFQTETSGTIISNKYLNTQTNGRRAQTIFTVATPPCCGRVKLGGSEADVFTQEDIDNLLVSYVPHKETHGDIFRLNISNHNQSLSSNVSIHIIALGHRTADNPDVLNFSNPDSSELVHVLPADILVLEELKKFTSSIPIIKLLKLPEYGHLEMRVPLPDVNVERRSITDGILEFRYDELQQGWIVYVWDYRKNTDNDIVTESLGVLVRARDVLPGNAVINITIYPPPSAPSTFDPSESLAPSRSSNTEQPIPASSSESGFPVYTLVPIIGIILFLLLLIFIVAAFCFTQQKRIKKKWVPTITPHHHHHQPHSPWSTSSPPIPTQVAHYDYDPSGMPTGESDHNTSDTSSGFSEPDCSPRHTPIQSIHPLPHSLCSSPSYHPPRGRMRSNVSITFSSRQSTVSEEMSVDGGDTTIHSSLSQYPLPTSAAMTLPARPASHTAFTRAVPDLDSGMVSLDSGAIENSGGSLARKETPAGGQERKTGDADQSHRDDEDDDDALSEWTDGKALPDFSDPDIQKLFSVHNPVLKKEEYWV